MAHAIEIDENGQAKAVYVGKPAWHKLGTVLPEGTVVTLQELLELSGTNWRVLEQNPTILTEFGVTVLDQRALYRSDNGKVLHVASPTYAIHQHTEVAEQAQAVLEIAGEYGMDFAWEAGFSLAGGKRVVYVLKLNRSIDVGPESFMPYMMATTSHDESWSTVFQLLNFRPECQNMTRMALAMATPKFKIKHTSGSAGRVQEIREALKIIPKGVAAFEREVAVLLDEEYTNDRFVRLMGKVFPVESKDDAKKVSPNVRRQSEVGSVWAYDKRIESARGTAWGAFQAVSTWEQHIRGDESGVARAESVTEKFLSDEMTFSNRAAALLADEFRSVLVAA